MIRKAGQSHLRRSWFLGWLRRRCCRCFSALFLFFGEADLKKLILASSITTSCWKSAWRIEHHFCSCFLCSLSLIEEAYCCKSMPYHLQTLAILIWYLPIAWYLQWDHESFSKSLRPETTRASRPDHPSSISHAWISSSWEVWRMCLSSDPEKYQDSRCRTEFVGHLYFSNLILGLTCSCCSTLMGLGSFGILCSAPRPRTQFGFLGCGLKLCSPIFWGFALTVLNLCFEDWAAKPGASLLSNRMSSGLFVEQYQSFRFQIRIIGLDFELHLDPRSLKYHFARTFELLWWIESFVQHHLSLFEDHSMSWLKSALITHGSFANWAFDWVWEA